MESFSETNDAPSERGSESSKVLALPGNRAEVLRELRSVSTEAAELYESALWILAEPANPKRARCAAAAMREAIFELGKASRVVRPGGLKGRVIQLGERWKVVRRGVGGSIEGSTVEFAGRLDVFFEGVAEEHPVKRVSMAKTARSLDAIGGRPPREAERERADTMLDFDERFNKGLHGSTTIEVADVERDIDGFGEFVLSLRRPAVAADMRSIDNLRRKGPPSG